MARKKASCGCDIHKDGEIVHWIACWNEDQMYIDDPVTVKQDE